MKLNDFLPDYITSSTDMNIDMNKNSIIFGSNGVGKSSIYSKIKDAKEGEYHFLDYDDTRVNFKKSKNKLIIASNLVRIDELNDEISNIVNSCGIKGNIKNFGITKLGDCDDKFVNEYKTDRIINPIKTEEEIIDKISIVHKQLGSDFNRLVTEKNYQKIKNINDAQNEIDLLKSNISEDFLVKAKQLVTNNMCPVCDTQDKDIYKTIEEKIVVLEQLESSVAKELCISNENYETYEKIVKDKEFDTISFDNIVDYILVGGESKKIAHLNSSLNALKAKENELAELLIKKEKYYNNLVDIRETIEVSLKKIYSGISFNFNDSEHQLEIKLPRNIDTYSTGEINYILVCTKIYEFIGSNHNILLIDDILTSYDVVNQYLLIFLIAKVFSKYNDKRFICFTHNLETIRLMYNQRGGLVKNYYLDRVNGSLVMFDFNYDKFQKLINFNNGDEKFNDIYLQHLCERDVEDKSNPIHKVFHYDEMYSHNVGVNVLENTYFVNMIDDFISFTDPHTTDYNTFKVYFETKIQLFVALRVWIEKTIFDGIDKEMRNNIATETLGSKINIVFPSSQEVLINGLSRELLLSKKLMINDSIHVENRVNMPFEYIFNLKTDDIFSEIIELKNTVTDSQSNEEENEKN